MYGDVGPHPAGLSLPDIWFGHLHNGEIAQRNRHPGPALTTAVVINTLFLVHREANILSILNLPWVRLRFKKIPTLQYTTKGLENPDEYQVYLPILLWLRSTSCLKNFIFLIFGYRY